MFDDAVRRLEDVVVDLQPGQRLAAERELAAELGVSRLTVREVLKALAARGLLELSQGRRALVCDPSSAVLSHFFAVSVRRDPRGMLELHEIRRSLEVLSATAAARSATRSGVGLVERALGQMALAAEELDDARAAGLETSSLLQTYITADVSFHATLAVASGNRLLSLLLESLSESLEETFAESSRGHFDRGGSAGEVVETHRAVVEAARRRNPRAAADAMTRHLDEAAHDLRAAFRPSDPAGESR